MPPASPVTKSRLSGWGTSNRIPRCTIGTRGFLLLILLMPLLSVAHAAVSTLIGGFSPGAHVFDAEDGGQIGVAGHAEPLRHRLTIEDEVEGLMPMGILNRVHQDAIDVPTQLILAPIEAVNMERFRCTPGHLPISAHLPMPLLFRGSGDMECHVIAVVMLGGLAAELEDVNFGGQLGKRRPILHGKPER